MKRSILLLLALAFTLMSVLAFAGLVRAASVTLEWDANVPAPTGYRIYMRTGAAYGTTPAWQGTATTCTIPNVSDALQTAFVATAYQVGNLDGEILESEHSNEVVFSPPGIQPQPPKGLRAWIVQAIRWLFNLFG